MGSLTVRWVSFALTTLVVGQGTRDALNFWRLFGGASARVAELGSQELSMVTWSAAKGL